MMERGRSFSGGPDGPSFGAERPVRPILHPITVEGDTEVVRRRLSMHLGPPARSLPRVGGLVSLKRGGGERKCFNAPRGEAFSDGNRTAPPGGRFLVGDPPPHRGGPTTGDPTHP